jgi:type II secretory pathway component GspD/PulD (secretin)
MAGAVISTGLIGMMNTPAQAVSFQADAVKTEYLHQPITVNGGSQRVIMKLRDVDLRNLLKSLARKAGFNILLDESVTGTISVDLNNITINQALESIKDYADLVYMQDDKTLIVAEKEAPLAQSINQQVSQMIPVKYVNAKLIAEILNATLFTGTGAEGEGGSAKTATAEYRTNSIMIVGTENDVRLAADLINSIDVPRQSKTFKINHAGVVEVAQLLQATVFNDGVAPFDSSAAGGGDEAIATQPTSISVLTETFEEGSGAAAEVQGASGSSGGGQQQTFTLRSKQIEEKELKISPDGPLIVPDTRTNTLTIMGTVEQIALAEAVIPTLDQKLPQVAIEASLVEVSEDNMRELSFIWGQQSGQWATGFNNQSLSKGQAIQAEVPAFEPLSDESISFIDNQGNIVTRTLVNALGPIQNVIGLPTLTDDSIGGRGWSSAFSTRPLDNSLEFIYQLNAMVSRGESKLLANPTVVAIHNTEAVISITEEIVRRTTVTRDATGFTQTQIEIGEAGIILNILPKVTGDGFVNLRIRPSVSTIADVIVKNNTDTTTLLRRKDFAVQETRLADGQTLAIGGLIDEKVRRDTSKVPGLGDLPIIGTLFRTDSKQMERNELLMLVTPRIVVDGKPLISSSSQGFDKNPLVDIAKGKKYSSAPVPSVTKNYEIEAQQVSNSKSVNRVAEQNENIIEVPKAEPQIKPVVTEKKVNAYTIDDVMKEFGIKDSSLKEVKSVNKDEIDSLLDEYLPKGSK